MLSPAAGNLVVQHTAWHTAHHLVSDAHQRQRLHAMVGVWNNSWIILVEPGSALLFLDTEEAKNSAVGAGTGSSETMGNLMEHEKEELRGRLTRTNESWEQKGGGIGIGEGEFDS